VLIVFDLDGTLIDSRRDLADSANQLISERGGTPLDLDDITRMVGHGAAQLVQSALEASGLESTEDGLRRFLEIYDTRMLSTTKPYPGIPQALAQLSGHARAVLTNKPRRPAEWILTMLGLQHHFVEIVGGDGPHARKPDPAGLVHLMTTHGALPEQTVLVGDSPIDVETARRAGKRCCVVSYGFGYAAFDDAALGDTVPVAANIGQLINAIEALEG
jgi:phosphoglycolate phosphatase